MSRAWLNPGATSAAPSAASSVCDWLATPHETQTETAGSYRVGLLHHAMQQTHGSGAAHGLSRVGATTPWRADAP